MATGCGLIRAGGCSLETVAASQVWQASDDRDQNQSLQGPEVAWPLHLQHRRLKRAASVTAANGSAHTWRLFEPDSLQPVTPATAPTGVQRVQSLASQCRVTAPGETPSSELTYFRRP